jgi:hypothetical protein
MGKLNSTCIAPPRGGEQQLQGDGAGQAVGAEREGVERGQPRHLRRDGASEAVVEGAEVLQRRVAVQQRHRRVQQRAALRRRVHFLCGGATTHQSYQTTIRGAGDCMYRFNVDAMADEMG